MENIKEQNLDFISDNPRLTPLIKSSLSDKIVTIIGLGGGAEIAFQLLRAGILHQNLIDFDVLEKGNLVRHVCGNNYVGKNKAIAVSEFLGNFIGVQNDIAYNLFKPYTFNIFDNQEMFRELVSKSDIIICATDTDSSRYLINDICIELKKPAVFVGMFEKGSGGEVFTYIPGLACYSCISNSTRRQEFLKKYEATLDKKDCSSVRDVKSAPGLGIDQSFLGAITSRKVIDTILINKDHSLPAIGTNWIIWSLFGIKDVIDDHLTSILLIPNKRTDCISCS
jgi:molybdopterin/thiamine biosynthesis adenylyltransferase